jgi:RHS repeat-associated protein
LVTNYSYDHAGRPLGWTQPNGVVTAFKYDQDNRLTNETITKADDTSINSYAYALSPTGNRTGVSEGSGRTIAWTYDTLYRLTGETITGSATANGVVTYGYDAVGNRLSRTSTLAGVASTSSIYDQDDRVSGESFNANGDQTTREGRSQSFDSQDRLIGASGTGVPVVSVSYDGDGNRVSETVDGVTVGYLVDDQNPTGWAQVVEERTALSVGRVWTFGRRAISQRAKATGGTWATSFVEHDGHGSVVAVTDSNAVVTDTIEYDAFGSVTQRTGTTNVPLLYSGEWIDHGLGLQYLRARWYAPSFGRFISSDPRFESEDDTDSDEFEVADIVADEGVQAWHSFNYGNANPLYNLDPSGLETLADENVTVAVQGELAKDAATVSTQLGRQLILGARGFGGLTRAWEFGLKPYKALRLLIKATGLEAHHIIEKRFAKIIGEKAANMLSVAVTEAEHQAFTNAWRRLAPYGASKTAEELIVIARTIYKDYPLIMQALEAGWELAIDVAL